MAVETLLLQSADMSILLDSHNINPCGKPVKPHPDLFREIRRTAVEAAGPEPCSKDQFVDID